MDPERLRGLLEAVGAGTVNVEAAVEQLRRLPFEDIGFAHVDHHRALRQGVPEVILGEAKTPAQIAGVARSLIQAGQAVFVTRLDAAKAAEVCAILPELVYHEVSRTASYSSAEIRPRTGDPVLVVTAGTSDMPVAWEALETLRMCGVPARGIFDVGVAGLHRILNHSAALDGAPAVIVCAGMEGALASVVGGLVAVPVIGVPTSIGYGASLGGFTALLGMLTSCAAGVTVVNIDNGFGAAMAVVRWLSRATRQAAAGGVPA
ncbi:MAG TPA: nickel pincer cofactor biosynthesis protein LarB [Polyangiaceae bacterium]|jgi:NCAIR mutase (PurE)-related protein|nr:nickel pincer cofactor biosynthesis protein LarB [Polyangiaceae bacterium]